jgi:hypothetical protein
MQVRVARTTVDRDVLLEPVLQRLSSLEALAEDWDSYGALPPTSTALEQALGFCRRVAELLGPAIGERARPAEISPLANGGVELEWHGANLLIAVEVGPEGEWSYLKKLGSGPSARYEEENLAEEAMLRFVQEVLLTRS